MIVNFSIQNFGSIRDLQTLSFEASSDSHLDEHYIIHTEHQRLLKLILIYGANASGKTTVLKALNFLRSITLNPKEKKTDELNFNPFFFDEKTPNQSSFLGIEFIQEEIRYVYELEFSQQAVIREELYFHKPNKALVFKRSTDLKKQFTQISFGNKIKKKKELEKALETNTLWNNTVLGGFLKTNVQSDELKSVADWFSECLAPILLKSTDLQPIINAGIVNSEQDKKELVEILKKGDFGITDILIKKREEQVTDEFIAFAEQHFDSDKVDALKKQKTITSFDFEFEHILNNKRYHLPFALQSEGTQRYYQFAGILRLLIKTKAVVPIDELEDSLHPDLYMHFILSFLVNAKHSQVIASTHNREVLNNKDIFRNDAIWFTDRSETGATELYSLADFDSSVIRDTTNVFNAYKSGKLRGAPNLGDYYINLIDEEKGKGKQEDKASRSSRRRR